MAGATVGNWGHAVNRYRAFLRGSFLFRALFVLNSCRERATPNA